MITAYILSKTKIGERKSGKKQVLIDRLYNWIQLYNTLQTDINVFPPDLINLNRELAGPGQAKPHTPHRSSTS